MLKILRFLPLAGALLLAGCSDDNGTEPNPTLAVALGGAITVVQGQTGSTGVTVTRGGGFTGAVTLAATNLPAGVTATFDPATIAAGSGDGTSTLTLAAAGNAATGAATFTVTASGGTNLTATANGSVTVNAVPDFTLSVAPPALSVAQGAAGTANITIARAGGFAGAVNLSVANLPVGVTAGFDNAAPTGNAAVLTLTADAGAALGATNVTINGAGAPGNRSTQLALTITEPPGDFSLAADPSSVSIVAGENGQTTITISKTGSFTGPVTLTVTGLPDGVTADFAPPTASPGAKATRDEQATSVLTLTVGAAVAAQDYPLVVRGTAEGQGERTTNLTLTVEAAPVNGFTLSVDPSTLTIEAGQSAQATVTVNKTGTFDAPVTLSVTGLPTGVTAAFDPVSASPAGASRQDVTTTSVLTLTVDAGASAGNSPLVIHGTAEGQEERAINLSLNTTLAPVGSFSIAVDPAALTVEAGQTGQATVTIDKTDPFSGNVTLSVPDLPTGVTVAFNPAAASPAKTTDTQTQSTLTVTVANTVTAGDYDLTVRGSAEGLPDADAELTLTVTPEPGDFSLSVSPATVAVLAGQNGNATVTVSKTGSFTGDVTLAAVGLPANVTAAFNPPAASRPRASAARDVETQSTMTLTVGGGVAPNNYPFQIRGTAEGIEEKLIDVTLSVGSPPGPGNGNYKFCDLDDLPIWFAYQDGTSGWTQVTGNVAGDGTTYTFDITQGVGGVAYVTGNGANGYAVTVFHGSQAELSGNSGQCVTPNATRTLNGSVAGIGAGAQVTIAMGGSGATASSVAPNFQLVGVLNGPADLIATHSLFVFDPVPELILDGIIIRRGRDIADGGTIPVLDFSSGAGESFAPLSAQVTINNLGTDQAFVALNYLTPTTQANISTSFAEGNVHTVHGIGASRQEGQDLHQINAFATDDASQNIRGRMEWFKALAARTVGLGPALTAPTVTSLGNAPYPRYSVSGPIQAEYDDGFAFSASQAGAGAGASRNWSISATRAYFAGGTYTHLMQDMTAAGFLPIWALQVGAQASISTTGWGYSTNGIALPQVEGGSANFASRSSDVTP